MEGENLKLEIKAADGAGALFYQINYTKEEKEKNGKAYEVFWRLVYTYLTLLFKKTGREKYGDESFYPVSFTDNWKGFCLSIRWAGRIDGFDAIKIFIDMLEYVKSYDPRKHVLERDDLETVNENMENVKMMAVLLGKQVFEERRYVFRKDYYKPYD